VIADAHLVPDPEAITEQFRREFAAMLAAVKKGEKKSTVATTARRRPPAVRQRAVKTAKAHRKDTKDVRR
jgi:hypothetical protein